MKRNELIKLRKLVENEFSRRKRIKELLTTDLVREYIQITNLKVEELDEDNLQEILNTILESFTISQTSGIYVCTYAFSIDWNICYEDTNYYSKTTDINSSSADYKIYADIESSKLIRAIKDGKAKERRPLIADFEKDNIVLNPYNTHKNNNGYEEVKFDFFKTALKDGQAKAKKLILTKYHRI